MIFRLRRRSTRGDVGPPQLELALQRYLRLVAAALGGTAVFNTELDQVVPELLGEDFEQRLDARTLQGIGEFLYISALVGEVWARQADVWAQQAEVWAHQAEERDVDVDEIWARVEERHGVDPVASLEAISTAMLEQIAVAKEHQGVT